MCGICGIVTTTEASAGEDAVWQMVRRLGHRGPDDAGVQTWGDVAFGHTRLSIIDLSPAGHQPMPNEDETLWITYNGEIYNFPELRRQLDGRHRFRSKTDTEIILHAYEEWGTECVERFNGIFAFVIYDARKGSIFAARDHIGVKPFYYFFDDSSFVFASEIKALFALDITPRLAKENIAEFLMYGWLADGRTLFEGVKSLEPGHYLTLTSGDPSTLQVSVYYSLAERVRPDEYRRWETMPPDRVIEHCRELLERSVSDQMVSDVPLGTLCSGGLDSSLVTALALRHNRDTKIYNVSLSDDHGLDEQRYARAVADHLGIEINYYRLDAKSFGEALVETIYHSDFPIYNLNAVAVFHICRLAREQGVKVLLAGEGGDELFGGYSWRYQRLYLNLRNRRLLGKWISGLLNRTIDLAHLKNDSLFLQNFRTTAGDIATALEFASGFFGRSRRYNKNLEAYGFIKKPEEQHVQAAMLSDIREYLEHLLNREDKHSMQTSIECRVPILDLNIIDFAVNLPYRYKVLKGESKWILKKVAEIYLPHGVIYRKKIGFNLPSHKYVRFGEQIFKDGFWQNYFGISPSDIAAHCTSTDGSFWYGFLVTEIWGRLFLNNVSPEAIKVKLGNPIILH